jgi:cytochrome c
MYILENTNKLKKIVVSFSASLALAASASAATYTVQPGDTLGSIAEKLGFKSIAAAGITSVPSGNLALIRVGDKIEYTPKHEVAVDGGVKYKVKDGKYTEYYVNENAIGQKYGFGREATEREVKAWDIDVMPLDPETTPEFDMKHGEVVLDENGNPKKAQGTVAEGEALYVAQCQMCHGDFGAGGKGYPPLSGGDIDSLTNQLMNPADENPGIEPPRKMIGSYWPYASTLFWYIQDAMPFNHPKSLSNSETYALTAYLLYENFVEIDGEELDEDFVLDKETFLKIRMPNEDGFYPNVNTPEDRHQAVKNMTEYLANPENYGAGTRCMTNCLEEPVENLIMRIDQELDDFNPPASTVRELPPKDESGPAHPGLAGYENYGCAGCHANAAIGAPVTGDKDAWAKVMEKGLDTVYANGINGINAMPPKGGIDMSDDEFKQIVDYMIEASK